MHKLNIKKIRETKGFSQAYIADKLGVTQSGYCKMEQDALGLPLEKLIKISEVLDFDLIEIIQKEIDGSKAI
ncbi:MAG: helix-turn-helix transcriptional regulator [Chloroflexia bacterium]|nr:helix-turn-helix transcriptional regulator [Chloroflexia bacterium]